MPMTRKHQRLALILSGLSVVAVALALILNAMRDSIMFFSTPVMIAENQYSAWPPFPAWRRSEEGFAGARRQPFSQFQGVRR